MNDRSFAAQLAEDLGPDDVRLVLSVFQADVSRLTALLDSSAVAGDVVAFRRAAHGLAGAAGAVGAAALERACRAAMTGVDAATLQAARADILTKSEDTMAELAIFVGRLDASG